MLPSNRTVLQQMFADEQYRQFTFGLADLLKPDPGFTFKRQAQILRSSARGERIVPFEDVYVVNSSVPPVPSKAFVTFIEGGQNKDRLLSQRTAAGPANWPAHWQTGSFLSTQTHRLPWPWPIARPAIRNSSPTCRRCRPTSRSPETEAVPPAPRTPLRPAPT